VRFAQRRFSFGSFLSKKKRMNRMFLCHFFKKSSTKIGPSRNAHPSRLYASGMANKERSGPTPILLNALWRAKALYFFISFGSAKRVMCALKAALKA
jgi:hypothetical protein